MINLIVFTKIDTETKEGYFNNFLGKGFAEQGDFIIKVESALFVSDMITSPAIEKIADFKSSISENRIYVIYHETSPKLKRQRAYIQSFFNNDKLVEYVDHHNEDGLHFEYIAKASVYYYTKDYDNFFREINLLTERLNADTEIVAPKDRDRENMLQSKVDLLYHCLHPDTRIKVMDFLNQWESEKEIAKLMNVETDNQFADEYVFALRNLRNKLLHD